VEWSGNNNNCTTRILFRIRQSSKQTTKMMTRLPFFSSLTLMSESACRGSRPLVGVGVGGVGFSKGVGFFEGAGCGSRAGGIRLFSSSTSTNHRKKSTKHKNDAALSALKLPTKWQHAVKQIPKEHILPGYLEHHKLQAFFGDKLLGAAAARAIENAYAHQMQQQQASNNDNDVNGSMSSDDVPAVCTQSWSALTKDNYEYSEASATKLISTALSNQFFAARVATILPDNGDNNSKNETELSLSDSSSITATNHNINVNVFVEQATQMSTHSVGTMVEAAVAAVKQNLSQSLTSQESEEAIGDLVDWLLGQALELNHDVNSKGQLLELGGSVARGKKIAGSEHEPLFEAVATLHTNSAKAEGRTKKGAEQEAARVLLQQLGYIDAPLVETNSTDTDTLRWEPPRDEWNYFEREGDDEMTKLDLSKEEKQKQKHNATASDINDSTTTSTTLKTCTPEDWWMEHAFVEKHAFRAAMLAPTIFPKVVVAVDSWTRRPMHEGGDDANSSSGNNNGAAAVLMVISFAPEPLKKIKTASSGTGTETIIDANDTYVSLTEQDPVSGNKARARLGRKANYEISKQLVLHLSSSSSSTNLP
jgi:dsRNA-specific ribonuclease